MIPAARARLGLWGGDFYSLPILIDPRIDYIYIIDFDGRPRIVGSVPAFGAIFAYHLAEAYRPEGVPR